MELTAAYIPRPAKDSSLVLEKVTNRLLPKLMRWLEVDGAPYDADESEVRADILKLLKNKYDYDGFKLANSLGWDGDAELVDILDETSNYIYSEHAKIVEDWVKSTGIKPLYKIGDQVRITRKKYSFEKGVEYIGEIVSIDEVKATYTVCVKEMGHIGASTGSARAGTIGFVYPFEKVQNV